jgi:pyruvate dehydrogenase E2 component (dihydrolipoamide acetyltransferase)
LAVEIILPKLTDTMEEGTLVSWLKIEGEAVEKDEPLLVVETDKANVDVMASASGILAKVLIEPGATLPFGTVIGYIALPGETLPEVASLSSSEATEEVTVSSSDAIVQDRPVSEPRRTARLKASPAAKKMARQHDIDLSQVTGSDPSGRITKDDVLGIVKAREQAAAPPAGEPAPVSVSKVPEEPGNLLVLSGMRKAIAKQMTRSARTAPHVTITMEIDMTDAVRMRDHLLPEIEKSAGARLSLTHLFLKAVAAALEEHPMLNSRWTDEGIYQFDQVNLGIAVAVADGLIVPVLRAAGSLDLAGLVKQSTRLTQRARERTLGQEELSGGTFTVSNLGIYGVEAFTPIINPPETAILGVGRCAQRPVVVNDELAVRWTTLLSLSFDHRVVDGVQAAEFLTRVKDILEQPSVLAR